MAAFAAIGAASAYTFKTLHGFCAKANCADGSEPTASLVRDSTGNLYGTTQNGGAAAGAGTVFELAFDGANYSYHVLYDFCSTGTCTDGANPGLGALVVDGNGDLYGTTVGGGANNVGGAVFELVPNATRTKWTFKKLYDFCSVRDAGNTCTDGYEPSGLTYAGQASGAIYDGTAPLYGTTSGGGVVNSGAAFVLKYVQGKTRRKEAVLYSFCTAPGCPWGSRPYGITADANGNLFGVTFGGGDPGGGVLYELVHKNGYVPQLLYSFCSVDPANCSDGAAPIAAPAIDSKGRLIGTTSSGGAGNNGVLYRFTPKAATPYTVLYYIAGSAGSSPRAPVLLAPNGDIFGTSFFGGFGANCSDPPDGCGVVWRWHNFNVSVLHVFCKGANCNDGSFPWAGLTTDPAGHLFGATSADGPNATAAQGGTVFELLP